MRKLLLCCMTLLFLYGCDYAQLSTSAYWGKSEPVLASGNSTQQAEVGLFDSLAVNGPFDVDVRFIPQQHYIHYAGNATLVGLVNYYVKDGTLHVFADPSYEYSPQLKMLLTVEVPMLRRVYYHGSGRVNLAGLDADHFILNADGSGYFYLTGKVSRLDASLGGTSRLNAKCLRARTIFVNTGGMAQAEVANNGSVSAFAGGMSDIYYYEQPRLAVPFEEGSGSVMRMEGIADAFLPCEMAFSPGPVIPTQPGSADMQAGYG